MEDGKNSFSYCFVGVVFVIFYRLLLDYSYFEYISPNYSYSLYMGFHDYRSYLTFFISWIVFFLSVPFLMFCINEKKETGSTLILFFIYLLNFIPFTTYLYSGTMTGLCSLEVSIYYFSLFFYYWIFYHHSNDVQICLQFSNIKLDEKVVICLGIILSIIIIYISYQFTGFRLNFSLDNVYKLRREAREYEVPLVMNYLFSMSGRVLSVILGWLILKKKLLLSGLCFCILFLSFGINGLKSTLFMPFLVIIILILHQKLPKQIFKLAVILGLVTVCIFGIVEFTINDISYMNDIIIRRVLFVPVHLHDVYYQFMETHDPDFFLTPLRHFGVSGHYNNVGGITRAIGFFMTGRYNANPNNGLYSAAIANLGILGIFIAPFIIIMLLRIFDKFAVNINKSLIVVLSLQFVMGLIGGPLIAFLLAGGGIPLLFCMVFMNRERKHV